MSLLLICLILICAFPCNAQEHQGLQIWDSEIPFPMSSEITFPEGIKHFIVQDCNEDSEYKFLHETAIGFCGNELIYGWYNNPSKELAGKTIQRARRSTDLGETWSEPEIVMDLDSDSGTMYVGLQFFSVNNELYLLSNLEAGAERPTDCILAKYDYSSHRWNNIGAVASRFLSMQAPLLAENGNFITSGSYAVNPGQTFAATPVVYVCPQDKIEQPWRLVRLDPNDNVNYYAETGVVVDGTNLLAITRREDTPFPNVYESLDFGETWRSIENAMFPTVHSKYAAGKFSNGIRYLVFNLPQFSRLSDGTIDKSSIQYVLRDVLAIAIARPNEKAFSHIFKISDPTTCVNLSTSHYPCVAEHDGWIYISYTGTFADKPHRVGALTKFPMKSLE